MRGVDMKVYSPSQTAKFCKCPILREFEREGWMQKEVGNRDYAAAIGAGFAAGVGVYNSLIKTGALGTDDDTLIAVLGVAQSVLRKRIQDWESLGLTFSSYQNETGLSTVYTRLEKAIKGYLAKPQLPKGWEIVSVEEDLGEEAGHARPDLIIRDEMGIAVLDYKYRTRLPAEYRIKTLQEFAHTTQMMHYAYFVAQRYNEPVTRFYIGLAVGEPRFLFDLVPYPVHEETLKIWYQATVPIWRDMELTDAGERVPTMAAEHSDRFGRCPMYKACFEHHFDPYLMARDYLHVPSKLKELEEARNGD
jgi:hypothetical protein